MKTENVKIAKNFKVPLAPGKYHRLLCLTGESKGTSYFLTGNRVILGRGDTVDIKVMDLRSSREHAELAKVKENFVLTDLGSQNGIVVNDLKVSQHKLSDGDKIIIGSTVYKYSEFAVGEEAQVAGSKDKEDQDDEIPDKEESKKKKKSKLPLLLVLGAAGYFLMGDDDAGTAKKANDNNGKVKNVSDAYIELMQKKKEEEDKEVQKKLESILHRGQRELREGNFFRAIEEFNLALVLSPNNGRASFYLSKTKQALDNYIEELFLKARRDYDSLRYDSAGQTYCAIIKFLQKYPDDERYKRAELQVKNVEKELGLFEGEYKCFEE